MDQLEEIAENIHALFSAQTAVREAALTTSRTLIRHCANAIRALHRDDWDIAHAQLASASQLAESLRTDLANYPDIYFAGYTQDALKEYAEASIVCAVFEDKPLPSHVDLNLEHATYLKGLAETIGEMRRRCLDILRSGHSAKAEELLSHMDDIYGVLVTMDYPNAITYGLRRITDVMRGVTERTRGDLMTSYRQDQLEQNLKSLESHLNSDN